MNVLLTICTVFVAFTGQTVADSAPTKPSISSITEENRNVTIQWHEPEQWNGEKELFNITISCPAPTHLYSIGCNAPSREFIILMDDTVTSYTKNRLEAGIECTVAVSARSSGGWSPPDVRTFTTMDDHPDPVEQLKCHMVTEGNNAVKLLAKWKTPCQQKSKALKYEIEVCQQSDVDESCKTYNTVPSKREQSTWSTTEVQANEKYRLQIYASNLRNNSPAVTCLVQL